MDSFKDVLEAAQAYCKTQMAEPTYNLYIDGLEPISFEDSSHITLSVRNDFICKIVTDRYLGLLKEAFKTVLGTGAKEIPPSGGITRSKKFRYGATSWLKKRPSELSMAPGNQVNRHQITISRLYKLNRRLSAQTIKVIINTGLPYHPTHH